MECGECHKKLNPDDVVIITGITIIGGDGTPATDDENMDIIAVCHEECG